MKHDEEPQDIGKDEMNLVEFPITLLAKRHPSESNILESTDTIEGENGKPVKREWTVTGSEKYGLPLAQDNDVLLALMAIGKEKNFSSRRIHFSRYRLCKLMRWDIDGRAYRRIEEALDRLTGATIKARNAFWDNEKKSYATKHFGIIDDYELLDSSKPGAPGQDTFPFSYVNLGEVLYESIQASYIKSIDLKKYFGLEGAIAKRLYRYLDKKAYNKKRFEIKLFPLAEVHLGLRLCKYPSQIKQQLNPAHAELIKAGFLKSAEYQKTSDGSSEKTVYHFRQKGECTELDSIQPLQEKEARPLPLDTEFLTRLIKIGVTRKIAEQILLEYPLETVRTQVEALPHRKAEDAPAALVSSIMNDWSLPVPYKKKKQEQARDEAEKQQRELEEQQKKQEKQQKEEHRARIKEYLSALTGEKLADLTRQAKDLARQEGGSYFKTREIPDYMVTSFLHVLVEKRLKD